MSVSVPWVPSRPASRWWVRGWMAAFVLAAGIGGFVVGWWGGGGAAEQAGPELVRLMRFMAGVKALLALGAAAAVIGRLGAPVTRVRLASYGLAVAGMAAGPGLIWGMSDVVAGSVLLHGGLVATVLLLWRDPGTAVWLERVLAARRVRRLRAGGA